MTCHHNWEQVADNLEAAAKVAAGQVNGAPRCNHAGCDKLVPRMSAYCLAGHRQTPADTDSVLLIHDGHLGPDEPLAPALLAELVELGDNWLDPTVPVLATARRVARSVADNPFPPAATANVVPFLEELTAALVTVNAGGKVPDSLRAAQQFLAAYHQPAPPPPAKAARTLEAIQQHAEFWSYWLQRTLETGTPPSAPRSEAVPAAQALYEALSGERFVPPPPKEPEPPRRRSKKQLPPGRVHPHVTLGLFASEYKLHPDWHEPDAQGVTATVTGAVLDNTSGTHQAGLPPTAQELVIHLHVAGEEKAAVNLADLLHAATKHNGLQDSLQARLAAFAATHHVTWHEPDEQDVAATVTGAHLGNSWGVDQSGRRPEDQEYVVHIFHEGAETLAFNLTDLLAQVAYSRAAAE